MQIQSNNYILNKINKFQIDMEQYVVCTMNVFEI
jgi:hypothetical protein